MIILFKWYYVYLANSFCKSSISITVNTDPDCSTLPPLKVFLFINSSIVLCVNILNYELISGHTDHENPSYSKGCRFGVCAAVSEWTLLTCYLCSCFENGALYLTSDCFALKQDINVYV